MSKKNWEAPRNLLTAAAVQQYAADATIKAAASPTTEVVVSTFLSLGIAKLGATWHVVETDCERVAIFQGEPSVEAPLSTVTRVLESRVGPGRTRVEAIAEFKITAQRKKVTA